jgi:sec-independent protein translocase protein TatA
MLAFWNALSPWHLLFIGIVAIVLFGNRLPEVARSLGRSVNEFKKGLKEVKQDFDEAASDDPPPRERLEAPPEKEEAERLDHKEPTETTTETKEPAETREPRS